MPRAERGAKVLNQFAVGHSVRPGRVAVIAQVERQNAVAHGKLLGNRSPVAAGPKQTVQDRNRRALAVFGGGQLNGHRPSLQDLRSDTVPVDESPIDLEAETRFVTEVQMTVAQLRVLAEQPVRQWIGLRPTM